MFWERFEKLCNEHNITPTALVNKITNSSSNATVWKKKLPKTDYLIEIANYFNVSIDYLLGRTPMPIILKEDKSHKKLIYREYCTVKSTPHVIALLDILGTSNRLLDENTEQECVENIFDIHNLILSLSKEKNDMEKDLKLPSNSIKYNVFSDSVVIAIECPNSADCFVLISKLSALVSSLQSNIFLNKKYLIRGALCYGNLYIDEHTVIGSGLVTAHYLENKTAIYPRIIIQPELQNDIRLIMENNSHLSQIYISDPDGAIFINPMFFITEINDLKKGYNIINELFCDETADKKIIQKKCWFKKYWLNTGLKIIKAMPQYAELTQNAITIEECFEIIDGEVQKTSV